MSLQTDAKPVIQETRKSGINLPTPDYEIKRREKITVAKSEKKIEQFSERQDLLLDPLEYPREGNDPGLVLIFNQEAFEDKSYRLGSRKDVNEILICMSRLGFNIYENYIFTDLTRKEILETVNTIVNQDLSNVNSLIVFFLTHGDNFDTLHAHDYSLQAEEFWREFIKCKQLENKPKMFIFQACKGDSHSSVSDQTGKPAELIPNNTFHSGYIGPDMLVVYSTSEGNVSFRDPKNGTWFIQELCKNFLAYGRRDDVVSLILRTTKCLCRNYYYNESETIKKQMPIFVSTLRKKFYLNRSKDRDILVKFLHNQEIMARKIKELEEKVNQLFLEKEKRNK